MNVDPYELKRTLEQALSEIQDGDPQKAEALIEVALAAIMASIGGMAA